MSYKQAAEEARIICNLDFSLVVPGGTFYAINEEKLPENANEFPPQAKVVIDIAEPIPVRTGTDFNDPVTRGVIRNYTAGLFINRYGMDVKQETALFSRYAIAIYALKTNREGIGYFVIVTARGLYEGRMAVPGMANKERLQLIRQILTTLTPYESTPAEINAVRERAANEKKDQERRKKLAEEAERKRAQAREKKDQKAAVGNAAAAEGLPGQSVITDTSMSKEQESSIETSEEGKVNRTSELTEAGKSMQDAVIPTRAAEPGQDFEASAGEGALDQDLAADMGAETSREAAEQKVQDSQPGEESQTDQASGASSEDLTSESAQESQTNEGTQEDQPGKGAQENLTNEGIQKDQTDEETQENQENESLQEAQVFKGAQENLTYECAQEKKADGGTQENRPNEGAQEEQARAGRREEDKMREYSEASTERNTDSEYPETEEKTINSKVTADEAAKEEAQQEESGNQKSAEEPSDAELSEEEKQEAERKRIAELEAKRQAHLAELRAKFAGNPQVEAGIDNYIARVDRTGDEVVATFRKFLRSVQEYASNAAFTGEDDPNYVNMLQSVRQEETNLGKKLDDLVRSVDASVQEAVDAGVTEAYAERMIRMVERLRTKYDKLAVAMNGRDRIAYMIPAEINSIVLKWQKFRENLPSQLEETDRRRELEISNRIHADILEKRASFVSRQQGVEAAALQSQAAKEAARAAQAAFDAFSETYEDKRSSIASVHSQQLQANEDAVAALNEELEGSREEVQKLNDELSHTFALNRSKKRDLSAKIEALNAKIAESEERLMQLKDATAGFEDEANRQLSDLEARKEALRTAADATAQHQEEMEKAALQAQQDFEQMKTDLANEEEEWRHVHENFLSGKYDDEQK